MKIEADLNPQPYAVCGNPKCGLRLEYFRAMQKPAGIPVTCPECGKSGMSRYYGPKKAGFPVVTADQTPKGYDLTSFRREIQVYLEIPAYGDTLAVRAGFTANIETCPDFLQHDQGIYEDPIDQFEAALRLLEERIGTFLYYGGKDKFLQVKEAFEKGPKEEWRLKALHYTMLKAEHQFVEAYRAWRDSVTEYTAQAKFMEKEGIR